MVLTLQPYSPSGTTKDADGYDVPAYVTEEVTVGKVQGGARAGEDTPTRSVDVGGVERPVLSAGLHIPIDAPVPAAGGRGIGWEYEVIGVDNGADPALVGRRFLVVGVPAKSFATARRLDVVEL